MGRFYDFSVVIYSFSAVVKPSLSGEFISRPNVHTIKRTQPHAAAAAAAVDVCSQPCASTASRASITPAAEEFYYVTALHLAACRLQRTVNQRVSAWSFFQSNLLVSHRRRRVAALVDLQSDAEPRRHAACDTTDYCLCG